MRCGKTSTGFEFSYDEARLDDMRMVDTLETIMDDEAAEFERLSATNRFIKLLLGKDGKERLYAHISESHEGRVPYLALSTELKDIMNGGTELKNLQASP